MNIALCLFGYVGSTTTKTNACPLRDNFEYIKHNVMKKQNVDVFIHSWQKKDETKIVNILQPKYYIFEEQKNFSDELKKNDWNRFKSSYQDPFKAYSFVYSRQRSNDLKSLYENENKFKYDCVITSRFDIGYHNSRKNKTSYINFNQDNDMQLVYSAYWDQMNAGPSDHWFYSNSKNIDNICSLYDNMNTYLSPNSEYIKQMTNGMFDTNADDWFSNEFFKDNKTTNLHKYTEDYCLNLHTLYKWHMYKNNLWNDKCKCLNRELWYE